MSNAIYKKDLHDVALAVAQGSKNYTDKVRDSLRWEFGTYDLSVETVNGTTVLLPTPANTIQATMDKIYGASKVSENLIVLNDVAETTTNGITYKVENGAITLNGTSNANTNIWLTIQEITCNGTYYFKDFQSGTLGTFARGLYKNNVAQQNLSVNAINMNNVNANQLLYYIPSGQTFANAKLTPMLVKGTTAPTEFKVGYTGIHNFEWTGVKVEGSNLLNPDNTFTYSTYTDLAYFECVGGATYTLKSFGSYTGSFGIFKYDGNSWSSIEAHALNSGYTITAPSDAIRIGVNGVVSQSVMAVRGSTAPTSFSPYITPTTTTIDLSSILYNGSPLFEGNSIKGVGSVKDEVSPYKAIKRIGRVKAKDLVWTSYNSTRKIYIADLVGIKQVAQSETPNMIISGYDTVDWYSTTIVNGMASLIENSERVIICDTNYDTTTAFINHFTDTDYIYYELVTPIEANIDLSQLVKFEAYSNGSITLVNTNNQDTTSTIKYLKEVAK